jgi:hypothetical protein
MGPNEIFAATLGKTEAHPSIQRRRSDSLDTRSLSSAALRAGRILIFKTQGSAPLHPGLLRLRRVPQVLPPANALVAECLLRLTDTPPRR